MRASGWVCRREPAGEGELAAGPGRWRVGRRGADTAEFLFSANPGEDPRPLAKVVSGGELSRTMLAVRTVLSAAGDVPTMVFDEVDAGIGGRVAEVVGQKLAHTARGRQVLCVTHLAPIAVYAAQHLLVEKTAGRGTTRTTVSPLARGGPHRGAGAHARGRAGHRRHPARRPRAIPDRPA